MNRLVQLVRGRSQIGEDGWLSTDQLLYIFQVLHELIQLIYYDKGAALDLPTFLTSFGYSLRSHFIDKSIEILNVPRDLLAGSALAAYMAVTRRRIEPGRILFPERILWGVKRVLTPFLFWTKGKYWFEKPV